MIKKLDPTALTTSEAGSFNLEVVFGKYIRSGLFIPYFFFALVGSSIVLVIGSIALNSVKNHGLIPPPDTLSQYQCAGKELPFTLFYLHGSDRVKIKSSSGILDGTVHQNQLDWGAFTDDASMLGFLPPKKIVFEDANNLHVLASDLSEESCTITAVHSGHRRAIVE